LFGDARGGHPAPLMVPAPPAAVVKAQGDDPSSQAKFAERDAVRLRSLQDVQQKLVAQPAGKVRENVVPVLVQALKHARTLDERLGLMQALGRLGPAAGTAASL